MSGTAATPLSPWQRTQVRWTFPERIGRSGVGRGGAEGEWRNFRFHQGAPSSFLVAQFDTLSQLAKKIAPEPKTVSITTKLAAGLAATLVCPARPGRRRTVALRRTDPLRRAVMTMVKRHYDQVAAMAGTTVPFNRNDLRPARRLPEMLLASLDGFVPRLLPKAKKAKPEIWKEWEPLPGPGQTFSRAKRRGCATWPRVAIPRQAQGRRGRPDQSLQPATTTSRRPPSAAGACGGGSSPCVFPDA